ncbi:MAG: type III pantothenate kinase [Nitrospirae bacterium]|nr:type III pantothenate kinase [Nitrospirota bacterium]MCL5977163.1 type III pantothenate kinase [Nitrospirota bacterium]
MSILLAVDIGNSTIGLGLFHEPAKSRRIFLKKIPVRPARSAAAYKKIISDFIGLRTTGSKFLTLNIDVILSSVVPSLNETIIKSLIGITGRKPLIVCHKLKCGLNLAVTAPSAIGADRIANAVAGFHYFKKQVAIVDFGTATTVTVIGRNSDFIGGAIMPGVHLMQRALHEGTAKLPPIPLKTPKTVLGRSTASSITSGIIHGTAGAVEALINGMEKEIGFRLKLVLTGGHAKLMSPLVKRRHLLEPNLTFEGLRLIYLKNRGKEYSCTN